MSEPVNVVNMVLTFKINVQVIQVGIVGLKKILLSVFKL